MSDITRRRFLQSLLAASAGALFSVRSCAASMSQPHVLVVGQGVGGQALVEALGALLPAASLTCVDPGLAAMRQDRLTRVSDAVVALDLHTRTARTAKGVSIGYDTLVLTPGADIRWGAIEGYTPAAAELMPHGWMGADRGMGLRAHLAALPHDARVIVYVPAGAIRIPAGVGQRVRAIDRYLAQYKPGAKLLVLDARPGAPDAVQDQTATEWLRLGPAEAVRSVDPKTSTLFSASQRFTGDLVSLIPPQQAGEIARRHGLADVTGWCPVDASTGPSLRQPDVHVLGAASAADGATKSATTARLQAIKCAQRLARLCA